MLIADNECLLFLSRLTPRWRCFSQHFVFPNWNMTQARLPVSIDRYRLTIRFICINLFDLELDIPTALPK